MVKNYKVSKTPELLEGVKMLNNYSVIILDLWGVVHDGINPYPGVIETMQKLKSLGKNIILLSNSPRRSKAVIDQIEKIGIPELTYDNIITSGELIFNYLNELAKKSGVKNFYKVAPKGKDYLTDCLIDREIDDINRADYILLIGPRNDESDNVSDYESLLGFALSKSLKLVCANPDLSVLRGEKYVLCAGAIAKKYQDMGGEVIMLGKPFKQAYSCCLSLFNNYKLEDFVAIGDSPLTDIKGANQSGIDSVFILNGVHKRDIIRDSVLSYELLEDLFRKNNIDFPTAFMNHFKW